MQFNYKKRVLKPKLIDRLSDQFEDWWELKDLDQSCGSYEKYREAIEELVDEILEDEEFDELWD